MLFPLPEAHSTRTNGTEQGKFPVADHGSTTVALLAVVILRRSRFPCRRAGCILPVRLCIRPGFLGRIRRFGRAGIFGGCGCGIIRLLRIFVCHEQAGIAKADRAVPVRGCILLQDHLNQKRFDPCHIHIELTELIGNDLAGRRKELKMLAVANLIAIDVDIQALAGQQTAPLVCACGQTDQRIEGIRGSCTSLFGVFADVKQRP